MISTRSARSLRAGIRAARLPWPLRMLWMMGDHDRATMSAYDATRERIEEQSRHA